MARPPKITNEEILIAARQVFLEQGFGASTLAIAERAGISEASIFKRFGTKEGLFMAAMMSETPQWVKTFSNQQPTAAVKSELTEICEQMLDFYQGVLPRVFMMMNRGNLPHPPPMPPPPVRDCKLLVAFLERAIAKGYLRSGDATTIAYIITGALTSYIVFGDIASKMPFPISLIQPKQIEPSIFVRNLIETLWTGIAPEN
jgi:AcrR family transcriptional regulator